MLSSQMLINIILQINIAIKVTVTSINAFFRIWLLSWLMGMQLVWS